RRAIARLFETQRLRLDGLARGLPDPVRLMETATQRLDDRSERLFGAARTLLERQAGRVRERAARIPHPAHSLREMARRLDQARARLLDAGGQAVMRAGRTHAVTANRLDRAPLDRRIARGADTLAALDERLGRSAARLVEAAGKRAMAAGQLLDSYSYENTLARGYVVVRDAADRPVTRPDGLAAGQEVELQFSGDRRVPATVTGGKPAKKAKPAAPPPRQGKLF
ncbi:MAG: exodeoxyribonuclease VII large subunit, partial [Rhodospirillaceae bacterium]|nr:exodeoxyribonuclease VII large subunit [Rhodospirillaceae bacterium]